MRRFPFPKDKRFLFLRPLDSDKKIQDFLDTLPINFEPRGMECRSVLGTIRNGRAHCLEGALIAAASFWYHGKRPLLLDLETAEKDTDHVVALFKEEGRFGAVSKTNHAVLRYRDPVYTSVHELVMSYFNEYFLDDGTKTLRRYALVDLTEFDDEWLTSTENVWGVEDELIHTPHKELLPAPMIRRLRKADLIERKAGVLTEWRAHKTTRSKKS